MHMARKLLGLALAAFIATLAWADEIALNPRHPDRYVVVPGDTLWDISKRFLRDPWLWPEVWQVNPQIENPHLIYPGDVITLVYVNGKPQLKVQRGPATVKLSPKARPERIDKAIPTIPLDAIRQFLTRPLVVGKKDLEKAAYVLSSPERRIVVGAGDRIYARGLASDGPGRYSVFRPGDEFVDPETGESLGWEAIYAGEARMERFGDPATLHLVETTREITPGYRLLPVGEEEVHINFLPHGPKDEIHGQILSVLGGVSQIGQYQVVVINRGTRENMEVGHVLRVRQAGETMRDPFSKNEKVRLPDEDAGLMMVFRTFEKVSYGLIMEATRPIHVGDIVTNP